MQISPVHLEGELQIGGGSGWVARQVGSAVERAQEALRTLKTVSAEQPGKSIAPHPREAALAAAREAVLHLNEALSVEAPEDAIVETRHALEELTSSIGVLESLGRNPHVAPGDLPTGGFERAIARLLAAETKLHDSPIEGAPSTNPGIVPPWLETVGADPVPVKPVDPDVPHIMGGAGVEGGAGTNPGIVPPWLQTSGGADPVPVRPVDPDVPHIM